MDGGLYIHVPFCRKRCPYCDFVLIESDGSLHDRFVSCLLREMEEARIKHPDFEAATIYFGGGTPSMLKPGEVGRIIEAARTLFSFGTGEVTLEANPEEATPDHLGALRQKGVNRLSLGIQSFEEAELRLLGRLHTPQAARDSVRFAREAGFGNITLDMIFGLPDQTLEAWSRDLDTALELKPEHISLYGLTYEPGTVLTRMRERGALRTLDDDSCTAQYRLAMKRLPANGYDQYEISNFARPGFESKHNSNYWERRPYLGFGPGAHSYIPEERWWNLSNVRLYLDTPDAVWKRETLTPEQQEMERIMLGLRKSSGLVLTNTFRMRHGRVLDDCITRGVVRIEENHLVLTEEGKVLADAVVGKFV